MKTISQRKIEPWSRNVRLKWLISLGIVAASGQHLRAVENLPDELPKDGIQFLFEASARPASESIPDGTNSPADLSEISGKLGTEIEFNQRFPNGFVYTDRMTGMQETINSLNGVRRKLSEITQQQEDQARISAFSQFVLMVNFAFDGRLLSDAAARNTLKMLFDPDPAIVYEMTIENPLDEPMNMSFALDGDIGPLSFQGPAEAGLTAHVTDTGGAAGADLSVIQTFSVSAEDADGNVSNRFTDFTILTGDATDSNPIDETAFDDRNTFAAAGETPVGMRIGTDLTLSPGDTATLTGFFSIGDTESPLPSDTLLATLQEFLQSVSLNTEGVTLSGDFNNNGSLDAEDIDILSAMLDSNEVAEFDLDNDGAVGQSDRILWVNQLANTFFGDTNLDGEFNTTDMINAFSAGEYEDGIALNSTWEEGDWNGDREFDSGDLIAAFQDGGFESGPRVNSVPEPTSLTALTVMAFLLLGAASRSFA